LADFAPGQIDGPGLSVAEHVLQFGEHLVVIDEEFPAIDRPAEDARRGEPVMARFTPTPASWINQVERWFTELTRKQLQRGVHRSAAEFKAGITAFIKAHNENPKPYRWVVKPADEILASVKRFCQRTQEMLQHDIIKL
jgi:hypothetical protein